jgi:hypothetical protein
MERDVLLCGAVQPHTISGRRRYYLMRRSSDLALPEPPAIAALRIRRLNRHSAARVFPLEEAYQREEVLTHPERFSPTAHYLHFTRSIRHNRIYFAELRGVPVGKAGTNAIGLDYSQVGGVFTDPEYRGMGISRALMHRLLGWIHGRGQSAALFVDIDNQPACRLYKGLDFRNEGRYMILYTKLD